MPMIERYEIVGDGLLGIWKVTETEAELRQGMTLYDDEQALLETMRGSGRRLEFLASRRLLHELSGRDERATLLKDELGKPYLPDSDHHISLSHSGAYAAVIASKRPCGIDIQVPVEKIYRIFHRFASEAEAAICVDGDMDFMHLLWGAKESIFKAYGRGGVDFRSHIHVPEVEGMLAGDQLATLCHTYAVHTYVLHAFKTQDYYLTYCTER